MVLGGLLPGSFSFVVGISPPVLGKVFFSRRYGREDGVDCFIYHGRPALPLSLGCTAQGSFGMSYPRYHEHWRHRCYETAHVRVGSGFHR